MSELICVQVNEELSLERCARILLYKNTPYLDSDKSRITSDPPLQSPSSCLKQWTLTLLHENFLNSSTNFAPAGESFGITPSGLSTIFTGRTLDLVLTRCGVVPS